MTLEKSSSGITRLSLVLSIIALALAGTSLWQSAMIGAQDSHSYVELIAAKYTKVDYKIQEQYLRITGTIQLKNVGNSEVEIQDIYWKPYLGKDSNIEFRAPASNKEPIMFLSDNHEIEITMDRNFPFVDQIIPMADIKSYFILPNKIKIIYFFLIAPRSNRGPIIEPSTEDYLFMDIIFSLSNGQEIITRPWYGLNPNMLNEGGVP